LVEIEAYLNWIFEFGQINVPVAQDYSGKHPPTPNRDCINSLIQSPMNKLLSKFNITNTQNTDICFEIIYFTVKKYFCYIIKQTIMPEWLKKKTQKKLIITG
jgi:hypothetical protein